MGRFVLRGVSARSDSQVQRQLSLHPMAELPFRPRLLSSPPPPAAVTRKARLYNSLGRNDDWKRMQPQHGGNYTGFRVGRRSIAHKSNSEAVSVSEVRAHCITRPVSERVQPYMPSPFTTAAPKSRLRRARARADETILIFGFLGHGDSRFVHPDPPGQIRSWKI